MNVGARVRPGDHLATSYVSSIVATIRSSARLLYDDGTVDLLTSPGGSVAGARAPGSFISSSVAQKHGWLLDAVTFLEGSVIPKRGQLFAQMSVGPSFGAGIARGYIYDFHALHQGVFEEPGPEGGTGHLQWVALAGDVTPVDVTRELAVTNAIRKIHGFAWYYNCAAEVANRLLDVRMRNVGLALPTGFAADGNPTIFWVSAQVSLQTGEEGNSIAIGQRVMTNDNGTVVIVDTSTLPSPFPYMVEENDLADLIFDITAAHADDRHSIYLLQEEWVVV